MRALVTGATGFVGRALLREIAEPVILSRDPFRAKRQLGRDLEVHGWDPMLQPPPAEAFQQVVAVFHLAGEPVAAGRWTAERMRQIRESRVLGTLRLVEAMARLDERPRVLVSASAVGYYGDRGDHELDESASPGNDFLAEVCQAWEETAGRAREAGIRVVCLRIGVVLGPGGGALAKMLPPFRLGLGGRLASGRQWMPWIHLDDVVGLFRHAAMHSEIDGPMNAVSPQPATNREFTRTLARVLRRPAILPVPGPMLRLVLGGFADVLLCSQRVLPKRAIETGYTFRYPQLEDALAAAIRPPQPQAEGTGSKVRTSG
jgi:hypothetical protein